MSPDVPSGEAVKPAEVPNSTTAEEDPQTKARDDAIRSAVKNFNNKIHAANIDPPKTGDWHATSLSALNLAKSMDNAFYHLEGGINVAQVNYILPSGKGACECGGKFPNDNKFSVKYPVIEGDPPHPQVIEVRGRDGEVVHFHPGLGEGRQAYSPVTPFTPGGSLDGPDVLAKWPLQMPSLAMSHFVTGKDVFVPLISAITAANSGYTTTTEERTVKVGDLMVKDYRILASRKASPANHNEASLIELVVDGRKFVPVTMINHLTPAGKQPSVVEWGGKWKGGMFNPKDFQFPH
jgi:hypothetical protein